VANDGVKMKKLGRSQSGISAAPFLTELRAQTLNVAREKLAARDLSFSLTEKAQCAQVA
jgi:hypothetical protein